MTLANKIGIDDYHKEIDNVYKKMLLGEYKPEEALEYFQNERNKLYIPHGALKDAEEEIKKYPNLIHNEAFLESYNEAVQNNRDALFLDGFIKKIKNKISITDVNIILGDLKKKRMVDIPPNENFCNIRPPTKIIKIFNYLENQVTTGVYYIDDIKEFMVTYIRNKDGKTINKALTKALERKTKQAERDFQEKRQKGDKKAS